MRPGKLSGLTGRLGFIWKIVFELHGTRDAEQRAAFSRSRYVALDIGSSLIPLRRLLECIGDAQRHRFLKGRRDDLQPCGQMSGSETGGNNDSRKPGQVERIGKTRTEILLVRVHGRESFRRARRTGHGENIDAGKMCAYCFVQDRAGALRSEVVRRAQESALKHASSNRAAELPRRLLERFLVVGVRLANEDCLVGFAGEGEGLAVDIADYGAEAF